MCCSIKCECDVRKYTYKQNLILSQAIESTCIKGDKTAYQVRVALHLLRVPADPNKRSEL